MIENRSSDDELQGPLRGAVEEIVRHPMSEESLQRALQRAAIALSAARAEIDATPRRPLRRWIYSLVTGTAATLLLAAAVWFAQPPNTWAQVKSALKAQKWIHVVSTMSEEAPHELWLSPSEGVAAVHSSKRIEFWDYQRKYRYLYVAGEDRVEKVPMAESRPHSIYETMIDRFPAILQGEGPTVTGELQKLLSDDGWKVAQQTLHKIHDGSKLWWELEVTASHPQSKSPITHQIRIDPTTRLPSVWTMQGEEGGQKRERRLTMDYPSKGPTDIFALGVSDKIPVVDRTMPPDVALVVGGIQRGARGFDHYHAVMVETDGKQAWWEGQRAIEIWRKGSKWRVDFPWIHPVVKPEDENVDRTAWWLKRVRGVLTQPVYLCDGVKTYRCEGEHIRDAQGRSTEFRVKAWNAMQNLWLEPPVYYSRMPEYICRPPLGIPNLGFEPSLNLKDEKAPPNTVTLEVRKNGSLAHRYVVDLGKQIVTQWGPGDLQHIVEQTAQSPAGHWYATEVRLPGAIRHLDKQTQLEDSIVRFYLDFEADLPDELFDPRK